MHSSDTSNRQSPEEVSEFRCPDELSASGYQKSKVDCSRLKLSAVTHSERFTNMLKKLWNDEVGVILSAELVLILTILVIGMIVGLVELQCAVVAELSDLGDAIGNLDQSYVTSGITSVKNYGGIKAAVAGARYGDQADVCDCNSIIVCDPSTSAGEKNF
jgi:Flp pilus assembly pilin Flp